MTRNQPGNQSSEGYQYGGSYDYAGQQPYSNQQRYPEENYPSDQDRGYNNYGQYPSPAPPRYGEDAPSYGEAQSYYGSNNASYPSYPSNSPPPPVPYNSRPHESPSYSERPYPERPYSESEPSTYGGPPGPRPGARLGPNQPFGYPSPGPNSEYGSEIEGSGEPGDRGVMGALAGGAAGAYGGHKVHHGFLGTVGGAVAGSMAENAWKKHEKEKKRREEEEEEEAARRRYAQPPPPPQGGGPGPGPMAGNFGASARGMRLEGTRLMAECRDVEGRGRGADIDLNDCLTNSNGRIHWQRHGNFGGSARGLRLVEDGTVLEAEAADGGGGWVWNRVWLNERITNEDGRLKMLD